MRAETSISELLVLSHEYGKRGKSLTLDGGETIGHSNCFWRREGPSAAVLKFGTQSRIGTRWEKRSF